MLMREVMDNIIEPYYPLPVPILSEFIQQKFLIRLRLGRKVGYSLREHAVGMAEYSHFMFFGEFSGILKT